MGSQLLRAARVDARERTSNRRAAHPARQCDLIVRLLVPEDGLDDLSLADRQPRYEGTHCGRPRIVDAGKPRVSPVLGIAGEQITLVAIVSVCATTSSPGQRDEPHALISTRALATTLDMRV